MSRSGYSDDYGDDDPLALGRWRAAVRSAMRGKRGQAFFREALAALDAMPEKMLIAGELIVDGTQCPFGETPDLIVGADELCDRRGNPYPMGACCLLGAVAKVRKIDVSNIEPEDTPTVAGRFGLADAMIREIVYMNDEGGRWDETPEQRWQRMRKWVASQITGDEA